jgi:hypothetical protein
MYRIPYSEPPRQNALCRPVLSRPPHMMENRSSVQPTTETLPTLKNRLVTIGLDALARGDWDMVRLITACIQGGGLHHV